MPGKISSADPPASGAEPEGRTLEMTVRMTPDMANFSGKLHDGALLNLLDRVAFSCASRFSKQYAVTLSMKQVMFKEPIHVRELVTFRASINHAGRTSMEVGIRLGAENIRIGQRRHVNSCYFTMVAVDDHGCPVPIPAHVPQTDMERRRPRAAKLRKELRREVEARQREVAQGEQLGEKRATARIRSPTDRAENLSPRPRRMVKRYGQRRVAR